jgi:hypothetical protein
VVAVSVAAVGFLLQLIVAAKRSMIKNAKRVE